MDLGVVLGIIGIVVTIAIAGWQSLSERARRRRKAAKKQKAALKAAKKRIAELEATRRER